MKDSIFSMRSAVRESVREMFSLTIVFPYLRISLLIIFGLLKDELTILMLRIVEYWFRKRELSFLLNILKNNWRSAQQNEINSTTMNYVIIQAGERTIKFLGLYLPL